MRGIRRSVVSVVESLPGPSCLWPNDKASAGACLGSDIPRLKLSAGGIGRQIILEQTNIGGANKDRNDHNGMDGMQTGSGRELLKNDGDETAEKTLWALLSVGCGKRHVC